MPHDGVHNAGGAFHTLVVEGEADGQHIGDLNGADAGSNGDACTAVYQDVVVIVLDAGAHLIDQEASTISVVKEQPVEELTRSG